MECSCHYPCRECDRACGMWTCGEGEQGDPESGECFPRCVKCHAHCGGEEEPECFKCKCDFFSAFCEDCCEDPTTWNDEYGCCADCAPGDVAVPAAEEAVAGAPAADADDAADADADDAAQVTAAMARVAVAAGGADSSPSGSSSSDSDSDGDGKCTGSGVADALVSKPYSELQAMAKARGIRANTKKEVMAKALSEAAGGQ